MILQSLSKVFPSRMSTGLLLPILAMADIFAVSWYRRHADWKIIIRLLPWALPGIGIGTVGLAAGLTTQQANAAGPIIVIYLLSMRLPKDKYIETGAWYFLILNWLKIPLFIMDGRISFDSIKADLVTLPLIAIGAFLGILILKKIPLK